MLEDAHAAEKISMRYGKMKSNITREEAYELLHKYNKEAFHIQHALTVEGVLRWYAKELGYTEEEEYWGITGLLHDIDFEFLFCLHVFAVFQEQTGVSQTVIE